VTGDARYRAIINTYYSLSASVLASFVTSMFVTSKKKIDIVCNSIMLAIEFLTFIAKVLFTCSQVHIQNATLAGGVAVGAVADMVIEPWGALLIGCCSGVISVLGYAFLSVSEQVESDKIISVR